MSATCQTEGSRQVTLLPREVRLVVERILLLTTLPAGMVPAVRDVILYSAAMGHAGLPALLRDLDSLRAANPAAIRVKTEAPGKASMDTANQHAWIALPLALDALAEMVTVHGSGSLKVSHALQPEEFSTASPLGARLGMKVLALGHGSEITLSAKASDEADAVLPLALREGILAEADLWWKLHHLSNTSLSPDTPESRRHAGPVIVLDDGRIVGRNDHDDDTDISLLTEKAP